jgi:hypothetical protein
MAPTSRQLYSKGNKRHSCTSAFELPSFFPRPVSEHTPSWKQCERFHSGDNSNVQSSRAPPALVREKYVGRTGSGAWDQGRDLFSRGRCCRLGGCKKGVPNSDTVGGFGHRCPRIPLHDLTRVLKQASSIRLESDFCRRGTSSKEHQVVI